MPLPTYFFHWKKNLICHCHFSSFTAKIFVDFATGTFQVSLAKFKSFLPLALFSLSLPLFRNLPLSRKFATGEKKTLVLHVLCPSLVWGRAEGSRRVTTIAVDPLPAGCEWNDNEMKQILGLWFLWNFYVIGGYFKLNCYVGKKVQKKFFQNHST